MTAPAQPPDAPPTADLQRRGRTGFWIGLAITLVYVVMRAAVYANTEGTSWAFRDTMMDGPRLVCLGLALVAGLRRYGRRGLGLHTGGAATGVALALASLLFAFAGTLFGGSRDDLGTGLAIILAVSSVIVGVFEEVLFRGLLQRSLHDWKGERAAVYGSAALFTAYHVQAQALAWWPGMFLFGVAFATLRARGVGLVWLFAAHGALDGLLLIVPRWPDEGLGRHALFLIAQGAYTAGVLAWARRRPEAA